MDASGNNSPDFAVTTQGTGAGELVWLASGQNINVSGISISGISVSAGPQSTTQVGTGVTGGIVWLAGSQTISVQISGIAPTTTAAGASGVTGLPVWVGNPGSGSGATATATSQSAMSTGLGVWLAPTQTVTAAISGVVPTTTAAGASGVTGLPVWVANPGSGSGATASATSQSAMSTALGVWLAPTQTMALLSTVATVLGTVLVSEAGPISISGIVPTTTASGLSGITGLPIWVANPGGSSGATATSQSAMSTALGVWLAPTQTISLVSTIVTVLGTQIVSVVPGLSVSAVVSGTLAIVTITTVGTVVTLLGTVLVSAATPVSLSGAGATATQSSLTTGIPVIFVQTQTLGAVNTILTILGTQVVSVVPGLSVSAVVSGTVSLATISGTTTASGLSGITGLPVWVANPGSGSGATASATSQSAMSTALGVWLAPTQTLALLSTLLTVLGTVLVSAAGPVSISGIAATTTASGLSGITGLPVWVANPGSGSGATASATSQSAMSTALGVWLAPTQTVALVSTIVTILGTQIVSVVPGLSVSAVVSGTVSLATISGTTTASGLSGITGLPVWVANPGSGSGATASATSQSAMSTALGVWLAPTQTLALISTLLTVLGTVLVSEAGPVSISGIAATTTASGLSGITGLPVWVANPGSGSGATASATSQSAMSTALGVWLAPTQTVALVSTIVTVLGTQIVSVVPGLSVSAAVSGTLSLVTVSTVATIVTLLGTVLVSAATPVSLSGAGATVTQSSLTTGIPVIFVQTQTIGAVNTIITVLGTQIVSVVPGLSVSAVVSGTVSLATISGTTTASGLSGITGLPVWVANPGSGSGATASATSQSAMSTALGVWLAPTQTLALVSTIVTILGTQVVTVVPGLSVSAVVSGTVSLATISGTTTASGLSGITGLPVWVANPGSGSGATATATSQSAMSTALGVWLAQTQTLSLVSTIVTILGTQIVSVVPGLSVSAVVSGTVSLVNVVATTTASGLSGITGLPVWVANPGSGGGATASATSQSAMSTALGVWLAPTQTLSLVSTVVTVLGTVAVSQVAAVSLSSVVATTTASGLSGITGLPVWIGNTVSVSVSVSLVGTVVISGIVPTTTASGLSGITGLPVWMVGGVGGGTTLISVVSTIVTILGFSVVTTSSQAATASGLAVWVGNPGGASGATATSQSAMSTALGVWLAPTQTLTAALSGIAPTTTASGLSGITGLPIWVGNTVSVTFSGSISVFGTVLISGMLPTTTASGGSGLTGLPVWQLNPAVTIQQSAQTPVNIAGTLVLAAAASSSAGPIPFTINVGTTAATVTSAWSVPATNFRLYAVNVFVTGAGATTPTAGYFQVAYSSAGTTGSATTPTILSSKPQLVKIPVGFGPAALSVGIVGGQLDIGGGLSQTIMLWFNYPGTTNTSATIMFNLLAYLF